MLTESWIQISTSIKIAKAETRTPGVVLRDLARGRVSGIRAPESAVRVSRTNQPAAKRNESSCRLARIMTSVPPESARQPVAIPCKISGDISDSVAITGKWGRLLNSDQTRFKVWQIMVFSEHHRTPSLLHTASLGKAYFRVT